MRMVQEETRKGPWSEHEDLQLDYFVGLLGERRWDFIAKVSGLNRSGKSCRLRWVNYLNPGLKRGKMTPEEELLVLELHSRWGNSWSRIARKLPGRTDNEIKNYWRTHMRKKAQERKRVSPPSSSSSHCCSSFANNPPLNSRLETQINEGSLQDKGQGNLAVREEESEGSAEGYSMDQIWNEIASLEDATSGPVYEGCKKGVFSVISSPMNSPLWDYYSDSLWRMDEEIKMLLPIGDHFVNS